jgi:hypothetical protein
MKCLILVLLGNSDNTTTMKNNSRIALLIFFIVSSIVSPLVKGQNKVKWEEIPNLARKITDYVPEGKALFVFEANEDFLFDSDNENLTQPNKDGLLYKLFINIEPPSGAITIKNESDRGYINYGKSSITGSLAGSLPVLKSKEIRYFRLSLIKLLYIEDVTTEKDSSGATDFQGLNLTDAMLIFYPYPEDLVINFTSNLKITKIVSNPGEYKLYVEPKAQKIVLTVSECESKVVEIKSSDSLIPRKVKYYIVRGPLKAKTVSVNDVTVGKGNFKIESNPPGATIEIDEIPAYTSLGKTTPDELKGYKSGLYNIKLSLNRFETYSGQINIGSREVNKISVTLVPTFAYINVNVVPPIPTTKVYLDNILLPSIQNGVPLEILKGQHTLKFEASHYYIQERSIDLGAAGTEKIKLSLKRKMGSLAILSGINAQGAEVSINGNRVGEIPIPNLELQEGSYEMSFKKTGYISENPTYTIEVSENKQTIFKDLKMINTRKIHITTSPVNGATVYIDNKGLPDKTGLNVILSIGVHTIRLEREHYKTENLTFTVDRDHDEFNFNLEELSYKVSFSTKPSLSSVFVNGKSGETPVDISLPLGRHEVSFIKDGCLRKNKSIFVSEPMAFKTKLFPSSYLILGGEYGLDQYRLNLGGVAKGVLISVGIQRNANSNKLSESDLAIKNVIVDDIKLYSKEDGRIYNSDSTETSCNLKLGFTIKKPIVFIVTIGCSFIQTDKFQRVYKAKHDYTAPNSGTIIYKGELFSEPYMTKNVYTAITGGLFIPIARRLYISADYYSTSDIGPGFSFGFGFIFKTS